MGTGTRGAGNYFVAEAIPFIEQSQRKLVTASRRMPCDDIKEMMTRPIVLSAAPLSSDDGPSDFIRILRVLFLLLFSSLLSIKAVRHQSFTHKQHLPSCSLRKPASSNCYSFFFATLRSLFFSFPYLPFPSHCSPASQGAVSKGGEASTPLSAVTVRPRIPSSSLSPLSLPTLSPPSSRSRLPRSCQRCEPSTPWSAVTVRPRIPSLPARSLRPLDNPSPHPPPLPPPSPPPPPDSASQGAVKGQRVGDRISSTAPRKDTMSTLRRLKVLILPSPPLSAVPPLKELSKVWEIDIVNSQVICECDTEGFIPNVPDHPTGLQHHSGRHHQPHTTHLPVSDSPSCHPLSLLSPLSLLPPTLPALSHRMKIMQVASGSIPASFGNMASLQSLTISVSDYDTTGDALTGPIPESFSNLKNLTSLDLTNNNIGPLTHSIASPSHACSSLAFPPFLTSPSLTSPSLPNLSLPNLSLPSNLTNNNIGPLTDSIGTIPNLEYLYLTGNNFTGSTIPSTIAGLSKLLSLRLDYTGVRGSIHPIQPRRLDYTGVGGSIPSGLEARRSPFARATSQRPGALPLQAPPLPTLHALGATRPALSLPRACTNYDVLSLQWRALPTTSRVKWSRVTAAPCALPCRFTAHHLSPRITSHRASPLTPHNLSPRITSHRASPLTAHHLSPRIPSHPASPLTPHPLSPRIPSHPAPPPITPLCLQQLRPYSGVPCQEHLVCGGAERQQPLLHRLCCLLLLLHPSCP
ncbi:unnamed protein product, partial [Closterium sp. NIES-64]